MVETKNSPTASATEATRKPERGVQQKTHSRTSNRERGHYNHKTKNYELPEFTHVIAQTKNLITKKQTAIRKRDQPVESTQTKHTSPQHVIQNSPVTDVLYTAAKQQPQKPTMQHRKKGNRQTVPS